MPQKAFGLVSLETAVKRHPMCSVQAEHSAKTQAYLQTKQQEVDEWTRRQSSADCHCKEHDVEKSRSVEKRM